jgi:hypothetical protein
VRDQLRKPDAVAHRQERTGRPVNHESRRADAPQPIGPRPTQLSRALAPRRCSAGLDASTWVSSSYDLRMRLQEAGVELGHPDRPKELPKSFRRLLLAQGRECGCSHRNLARRGRGLRSITSRATRSGCRSANSWAITPPIDRPRIVAVLKRNVSRTRATSSATIVDAVRKGRRSRSATSPIIDRDDAKPRLPLAKQSTQQRRRLAVHPLRRTSGAAAPDWCTLTTSPRSPSDTPSSGPSRSRPVMGGRTATAPVPTISSS